MLKCNHVDLKKYDMDHKSSERMNELKELTLKCGYEDSFKSENMNIASNETVKALSPIGMFKLIKFLYLTFL